MTATRYQFKYAADCSNNGAGGSPAPGYAAWFDAASNVFVDILGTIPASGDGTAVGRWESKGGSYGILECTTPPGYGACALQSMPVSGRPCVRSSAAALGLLRDRTEAASLPGAALHSSTSGTIIAVAHRASGSPAGAAIVGANNNYITMAYDNGGSSYGLRAYGHDGGYQIAPIVAAPNGSAHIFTWHHAGGFLYAGVDDTRLASMTSVACGDITSVPPNFLVLLGYAGPDGYMDGDVAEIIMYPTAVSEADRKITESYLGIKYGITLPY